MPQGKMKFKKASAIKKTGRTDKKKKGLQKFSPKNPSLGYKLNAKLTAEIGRNIEKSTAEKYGKGGGTLSILKGGKERGRSGVKALCVLFVRRRAAGPNTGAVMGLVSMSPAVAGAEGGQSRG
eukprot:CAMPEP_0173393560 /NCGR_PEP_ID=MMETSP1356-20130122/22184_1 /TAXON_ID=77927 ORGANISM="Hemiselmis virescens, Strain PCC157" /NCGR_SAMPLE_ID=MMETSP1356 /ASSEMBLY_ACC=CAM_ASM_000847 /LENGTH=122 /DNA_ID=CAMNT_0014351601 /DNA_START=55 /DNA_END=420 /DNA_ORIENTATION=+